MAEKKRTDKNIKQSNSKLQKGSNTKSYNKLQSGFPGNTKKRNLVYLLAGLAMLITLIVYLPSLSNDFANWDDDNYIQKNNYIKSLSPDNIKAIFTEYYFSNYHPLTTLTYAMEYHYFGMDSAFPYHITNLILHLINTLLVFWFIYLLTGKPWLPFFVAAFFGVHPLHVESVAWISERKDVMYALFFMLALISYIKSLKSDKIIYLFLTLLCFACSLLSKSAAVALPPALLIIYIFFRLSPIPGIAFPQINNKSKQKIDIKSIVFFGLLFIISAIFGFITIDSQKADDAIADLTVTYTLIERFFFVSYAVMFYIVKFIVPFKLCAMHYYPETKTVLLPFEYYLAPLVIILIIFLIYKAGTYRKPLMFGALFFLATIFLVLQIIPVGFAIASERYTYIPYIGLLFATGFVLEKLAEQKKLKLALNLLCISVLLLFSYLSWQRSLVWKDGLTLFTDVIEKNPESFHGYWIRGSMKSNTKDYSGAILDFEMTLKYRRGFADAYNNLGNARYNLKDYKQALADLDIAIKIKPDLAEAYANRANILDVFNEFDKALTDLEKAIKLKPDMTNAYNTKGIIKAKLGDIKAAIEEFNTAIKINPYEASAYLNRGNAKGILNDFAGSIEDFDKSISLASDNSEVFFNRGLSRLKLKDKQGACSDFEKALLMGNDEADNALKTYCK